MEYSGIIEHLGTTNWTIRELSNLYTLTIYVAISLFKNLIHCSPIDMVILFFNYHHKVIQYCQGSYNFTNQHIYIFQLARVYPWEIYSIILDNTLKYHSFI